jgi:YebC/PmpR family DNA-binding regulatory protein
MPKDNIERAIRRGTGDGKDGLVLEEVVYEGYAPKGVAMIIECVTDNRNRAVAEIRHMLNRYGGSLGEGGSVAWQFNQVAYFAFQASGQDADAIFELAVEAGADDVTFDDETIEIVGPVPSFKEISDALHAAGIQPEEAGLRMVPNHDMELDVEDTIQVMRVIEAIEELDDVQNVFSNLRVTDEAVANLEVA